MSGGWNCAHSVSGAWDAKIRCLLCISLTAQWSIFSKMNMPRQISWLDSWRLNASEWCWYAARCQAAYLFAPSFVAAAAAGCQNDLLCRPRGHCRYSLQLRTLLPQLLLHIFFVFSSSETSFWMLVHYLHQKFNNMSMKHSQNTSNPSSCNFW